MREVVIPEADDHVGAPAETRVDRVLSEEQAEGRIVRGRRHASDGVAGIDVLERDRGADPLEVVGDRVAQKDADIAVPDVARRVALSALRHQILAGAFSDHDHRVASALEPLLQR